MVYGVWALGFGGREELYAARWCPQGGVVGIGALAHQLAAMKRSQGGSAAVKPLRVDPGDVVSQRLLLVRLGVIPEQLPDLYLLSHATNARTSSMSRKGARALIMWPGVLL